MDTFGNRLQHVLDEKEITAAELARRLNVNRSGISNYLKGAYSPRPARVIEIARVVNCDPLYLAGWSDEVGTFMDGVDESLLHHPKYKIGAAATADADELPPQLAMLRPQLLKKGLDITTHGGNTYLEGEGGFSLLTDDDLEAVEGLPPVEGVQYLARKVSAIEQAKAMEVKRDVNLSRPFTPLASVSKAYYRPIVGTTAGGVPKDLTETFGEVLPIEEVDDPDLYFFMEVCGDSMSPLIEDGDFVLVRQQPEVNNGELTIVGFDNGETSTLKLFYRDENGVTLKAINKAAYGDKHFTIGECDAERIRVIGRVVEIRRKV